MDSFGNISESFGRINTLPRKIINKRDIPQICDRSNFVVLDWHSGGADVQFVSTVNIGLLVQG